MDDKDKNDAEYLEDTISLLNRMLHRNEEADTSWRKKSTDRKCFSHWNTAKVSERSVSFTEGLQNFVFVHAAIAPEKEAI